MELLGLISLLVLIIVYMGIVSGFLKGAKVAFIYNIGDVLDLSSTMSGYITIRDREYDKHKNPYYVIQYINKGEYLYRRTTDYINKFGRLVKGKELQTIKVLYGLS